MTTLGNAGSHRKSSRMRATSFHKLLTAGQTRPYLSKKAVAESQLSQFSQQQPMADLIKFLGEISIYCVHLQAILHVTVHLPLKNPC
jgi:hypothetical protein